MCGFKSHLRHESYATATTLACGGVLVRPIVSCRALLDDQLNVAVQCAQDAIICPSDFFVLVGSRSR